MSYISALERNYLLRKLGKSGAGIPLNQLRREWYAKVLGAAKYKPETPFNELEWDWLMKTIADGAGPEPEDWDDAWRTMVALIGQTPNRYTTENQKIYFRNAT